MFINGRVMKFLKRMGYLFFSTLLFIFFVEFFSQIAFRVIAPEPLNDRYNLSEDGDSLGAFYAEILEKKSIPLRGVFHDKQGHPYFGHVLRDEPTYFRNNHGFASHYSYPYQKKENDFVIGLFGGSVAAALLIDHSSRDRFTQQLKEKVPFLKAKNIVLLNMALGAFKQPQQYFTLSYFFEMFDMAIFLDGYNEIKANMNYPMFPLAFPVSARNFYVHDLDLWSIQERAFGYLRLKYQLADIIHQSYILQKSRSLFYLWHFLARWGDAQSLALKKRFHQRMKVYEYEGQKAFHINVSQWKETESRMVDIWEKYVRMSHILLSRFNIPHFFFLQPNQYVSGSKKLTAKEKKFAFQDSISSIIARRYGLLKNRTSSLNNEGVPVFDLTSIFEHYTDTVYIDRCCHLNSQGNAMVVDAIVKKIRVELANIAERN